MIGRQPAALVAMLATAGLASAEIGLSIDKLDPSDGIPMPPASLVIVDVEVNLSETDAFAALGLWGRTENGARLEYARDPNGVVVPTAPGPHRRFVTFFSRPRGRDADSRFGGGASVLVSGRYYGGVAATFEDTDINAAFFLPPPYQQPGQNGWVGRIALDLTDVWDPLFRTDSESIVVATTPPPNSIRLLHVTTFDPAGVPGLVVYSTSNDRAGIDIGVYGIIPEPATALALLVAAGALLRRR